MIHETTWANNDDDTDDDHTDGPHWLRPKNRNPYEYTTATISKNMCHDSDETPNRMTVLYIMLSDTLDLPL